MRDFAIVRIGDRYGLMAKDQEDLWEVLYTVCEFREAQDFLAVCRNAGKAAMEVVVSHRIGRPVRVRLSFDDGTS